MEVCEWPLFKWTRKAMGTAVVWKLRGLTRQGQIVIQVSLFSGKHMMIVNNEKANDK